MYYYDSTTAVPAVRIHIIRLERNTVSAWPLSGVFFSRKPSVGLGPVFRVSAAICPHQARTVVFQIQHPTVMTEPRQLLPLVAAQT